MQTINNIREIQNNIKIIKKILNIENFLDCEIVDINYYHFAKEWLKKNNLVAFLFIYNTNILDVANDILGYENYFYDIYPLNNSIELIEATEYFKKTPFKKYLMSEYAYRIKADEFNSLFFAAPCYFFIFNKELNIYLLYNSDQGDYVITLPENNSKFILEVYNNLKLIINSNNKYYDLFIYYEGILKEQGYLPEGDK